jgi:hypothetical protein
MCGRVHLVTAVLFAPAILESCVSLSSLVEGLTILLGGFRPTEEPKQCSIISNSWYFTLYVGRMGVACPLPRVGYICPCYYIEVQMVRIK